jgi:hypothetical protein
MLGAMRELWDMGTPEAKREAQKSRKMPLRMSIRALQASIKQSRRTNLLR